MNIIKKKTIFVISDQHHCHSNILTFKDIKGDLIRPGFNSIEEMDELIIENYNKTVGDNDSVYHLGDFCLGGKDNISRIASRLRGKKRLVLGNHDYEAKLYYPHFQKVMSFRQFGDLFKLPVYLCHFPLMEVAYNYRHRIMGINIHGHIHTNETESVYHKNVCVEKINYTPIAIESIIDEELMRRR